MDIWTFAAEAGARYIAQHLKGFPKSGNSNSDSSSVSSNKMESEPSPLIVQHNKEKNGPFRRLMQRNNHFDNFSNEREAVPQGSLTEEAASTSNCGGSDDPDAILTSRVSYMLLSNEDLQQGCYGDLLLKPSNLQPRSPYSMRKRSNIRSKRINRRFVRPLNSLESCLMAQLYKENDETKEYVFDKVPSLSMPTVRPLLVTDGSKIISRASSDFLGFSAQNWENKVKNENIFEENKTIYGVPRLPQVGSLEIPKKTNVKTRKEKSGRTSSTRKVANRRHFNSQDGSSNGAVLFCLGVTVGVISSFLANNREVDKLNGLLKQTENLVQDLQEELEMKDSLTVKELHVENYESHGYPCNIKSPQTFSLEHSLDESTKNDRQEIDDSKAKEESLSKIEAELEAELERLELSMNSSSLERQLSDLVEMDPEFAPDMVQGELRADIFGTQIKAQPNADRDGSGSSTTHSANYAVSPRELSLRLHELLQSRLEKRVIELETALQNSNKKIEHVTISEDNKPWIKFLDLESPAPSVRESSDKEEEEEENGFDEPVVINLSGEALDAYNEAYDEFANMDEEDLEENPESLNDHRMLNGNGSTGFVFNNEDEEESGDDDEMEKLLIKQILEKKRRGSPAVLNAQRVLLSLIHEDDDDDH